jgi:hypothetical protein
MSLCTFLSSVLHRLNIIIEILFGMVDGYSQTDLPLESHEEEQFIGILLS